MNITLRQLRVFEAVAERLSYTKAAESLYLSQPAVSMQIRQLEDNVGLSLFEKLGKKVHLTEAGNELHRYAKGIFRQLDEMEEVLESMKGVTHGRLDIAVASTVNYFAPRALGAFSRLYPEIQLKLDVTNRKYLVKLLEENEKDLVLMGQPPENLDLEAEAFMENPLVVIAPPDHPLAGKEKIPLERLMEESFLLREAGSGTRQVMERFFKEHQLEVKRGMEMTRNEAIKQGVRAGMGLGIVSTHTIELEVETGRLAILDVEEFPLKRQWHLVHRRGKRLSPAAEAFRRFLLDDGLEQRLEAAISSH
ncbi:MAG: LysR family transcriptional regulator [Gammaproteobacteria bacterium]|nr:LysR family transcriptional regulator [Gammaproteobacteria bacterium]